MINLANNQIIKKMLILILKIMLIYFNQVSLLYNLLYTSN